MKKRTFKHLAIYTALAMTLSSLTPGMISYAEEAKKASSVTAIVEAVSTASASDTTGAKTSSKSSAASEAKASAESASGSTEKETQASSSSKAVKTEAAETSASSSESSSTTASSTTTSEEVLIEIGDGPVDDAELGITSDEDLAALTDGSMIPEYNITSIDETSSNVVTENYVVAKDSSAAETTMETSAVSGSEDQLLEIADDVDEFSAFKTAVSKVAEGVGNFVSAITGKSNGSASEKNGSSGSDDTIAANNAPSSETTSVVSAPKKTVNAGTAVPAIATTASRQALINYAKQFLGNPYVYGGTSLTEGADCSGFVQQIFKNFGIKTGRSSRDQLENAQSITFEQLQPGDLVFYSSGDYVNHVAIYAGDGVIIHAANSRTGICTGRYDYREPYAYGRFINN